MITSIEIYHMTNLLTNVRVASLPQHTNKWENELHMEVYYVMGVSNVPCPRYKCMRVIVFEEKTYHMAIAKISQSTCLDFAKCCQWQWGRWVKESLVNICITYSSICARLNMPPINPITHSHSTSHVWHNKLSGMNMRGMDANSFLQRQ